MSIAQLDGIQNNLEMNLVKDSVSNCSATLMEMDDSLEDGEIRTPMSRNKESKKKLSHGITVTLYNVAYESPLTHFRTKGKKRLSESFNDSVIILDSPCSKKRRRSKKLGQSSLTAENLGCPDDSVIILSDSEIESNKKNEIKHSNDRAIPVSKDDSVLNSEKLEIIVVDHEPGSEKLEKPKVEPQLIDKAKNSLKSDNSKIRSSSVNVSEEVPLISNLSLGAPEPEPISIDLDDENTEPSNKAPVRHDDVAVVWMSLQDEHSPCLKSKHAARASDAFLPESNIKKTSSVNPVLPGSKTKNGNLVIMDTQGDFSNLHRLERKSKNINKKHLSKIARQNPNWAAFSNNNESTSTERSSTRTKKNLPLSQPNLSNGLTTYTTETVDKLPGSLREIIIDGSNIALGHTNGRVFSETGLKMVIDYFKLRGHTVKAFVPQHRRSLQHRLLEKLYTDGIVVFTPSRYIGGRHITPYDDRFILEYATLRGGIVISRDQYRDLYAEKPEWRDTIENRLLAPTFVGNCVMFPEDPLGKRGPKLETFLRH